MIFGLYLLLWGKKKDASILARCNTSISSSNNRQVDEETDGSKEIQVIAK
jgi:hypothetical protein